jgi:hypothetical protein
MPCDHLRFYPEPLQAQACSLLVARAGSVGTLEVHVSGQKRSVLLQHGRCCLASLHEVAANSGAGASIETRTVHNRARRDEEVSTVSGWTLSYTQVASYNNAL